MKLPWKGKRMTLQQKSAWTGRMFMVPLYIGLLFFILTPLIQSLIFAFSDVTITLEGYQTEFTGLKNLKFIFRQDPTYGELLLSSIATLFWQVPAIIIFSLFLALILKSRFVGRTFIRSVFFLPVILASGIILSIVRSDNVAGSVLSGALISSSTVAEGATLDTFLINLGLNAEIVKWFSLIYNNVFSLLWKAGIQIIIFLAALQSIPPTLYEASAVEGTTAWEDFWKITIPMITPMIMLNIFFTIIESFSNSENNLMKNKVMVSFDALDFGLASSMSWVYFMATALILGAVALMFKRLNDND